MKRRPWQSPAERLESRVLLSAPPVPGPFLFMSGYSDSAKSEFARILPHYTAIGGLTSDASLVLELRSQGKLFLHQTIANAAWTVQQLVDNWSAPFNNTLGGALPGGFDAIQIDEFGAYPDGSPESARLVSALQQVRQQYPDKRIFVWSTWQVADGGPNTLYGNPAVSYSNLLNAINTYADRYMLEVYINERNPQTYLFDPFADNIDSFAPGLRNKTVFGIYIPQSGFVADDSATIGFWGLLDEELHQIRTSPKTSSMNGAAFWIWYRSEPITGQFIGKLLDHYFVQQHTSYFGDGSMSQAIANPQFETNTSGWTLTPGAGGSIARFNYASEGIQNYHDDYGYATHLNWGLKTVRGSGASSASYTASVIPGMTYTVSAFVTPAAGSTANRARLSIATPGGQNVAAREVQDAPGSVTTGVWKRIIYNFTVPAGQTSVRVVLSDSSAPAGTTLYWDFVELEQAFVADTVAPTVQLGEFRFSSAPQSLRFTFSESVEASLSAADLVLTNNTTGTTVPPGNISVSYDAVGDVATFTFPGYGGGTLPGGSYTATFANGGVTDASGNALAAGYTLNFLYAAGDIGTDVVYARISPAAAVLQVWRNASILGAPTYTAPIATLSSFAVDGFAGDDTLTLDFSNGDVRPAGAAGFGYRLGTGNETLNLSGAVSWQFDSDPAGETPNLSLNAFNGALVTFASPVTNLASLSVSGSAQAQLAAGGDRVMVVRALSISGGASLNLNEHDLVLDYSGASPLAAVVGQIVAARSGGAWTGNGLTSTSAKNAALHNTTLGAMEASDFMALHGPGSSFSGQSIDSTAVLVKYTYYGDATFDGVVDITDLALLGTHWQGPGGWAAGDSDYSGFVDISDLALLATNWQSGAGAPPLFLPGIVKRPVRTRVATLVDGVLG